jgi:hypothetical protein
MGKLGDSFPEEEKRAYLDRQLRPGQVLYLFCDFTTPPKEKYLVLVSRGQNPLLFFINSRIHPFILQRPELCDCQVKVSVAGNPFLHHDSFIDCSKVVDQFDQSDIRKQILDDIERVRGELDAQTKQQILTAAQKSRTISQLHKQWISDFLK